MDVNQLKKNLRDQLKKGESYIQEVLNTLSALSYLSESQQNELAQLESKWQNYQAKRRKGLFYVGESDVRYSQLLDSLLELISSIGTTPTPSSQPVSVSRILFLAANPTKSARLRLDEEHKHIQESLRRSNKRQQFQLSERFAITLKDLYRALLDESPTIVHFAGHGYTDRPSADDDRAWQWPSEEAKGDLTGGIALQDGETSKDISYVSGTSLASLFSHFSRQIECVILNACFSEAQARSIREHIPFVIGMKGSIPDQMAIDFSVAFYDALASGRSIEEAYGLSKSFMEAHGWEQASEVLQFLNQS